MNSVSLPICRVAPVLEPGRRSRKRLWWDCGAKIRGRGRPPIAARHRNKFRHHPLWALFVLLTLAQSALAQPIAVESLTASVRFETDRDAERLLREARASIERKDWPQAALELRRLLDESEGRLVADGDVSRNVALEVQRLLQSSPNEARTAYARLTETPAAEALEDAGTDPRALRIIATTYPYTAAAEDSLWRLAQLYLDSGQFSEASLALARLADSCRDLPSLLRGRPDIIFAWCLATAMDGDVESASELAERFVPMIGPANTPARRSLEDRIQAMLRARPKRDEPPQETKPADWEFSTIPNGVLPEDLDRVFADLQAHSVVSYLQLQPIVVDNDLVARTIEGIARIDGETGDLVWQHASPLIIPSRLGVSPRVEAAMGDAVHSRLAAVDGHVYFVVPGEPTTSGETPQPTNRLIALDVQSGDEIWSVNEMNGDVTCFHGPPTPTKHGLLCQLELNQALLLAELDPATGAARWSCRICEFESGPSFDDRRLVHATPIAVASGLAICPTGAGGIAAVDLLSRTVVWGFRYPREPLLLRPEVAAHVISNRRRLWAQGWSGGFTGISSDVLVLASPESDSLWGLDSATGAHLWRRPRGDGVDVATLTAEHALVVSRETVTAVRLQDGSADWEMELGAVVGRAIVDGEDLVVPLQTGDLARVSIVDGTVTRTSSSEGRVHRIDDDVLHDLRRPQSLVRVGGVLCSQSLDAIRPGRSQQPGEAIPDEDRQLASLMEVIRSSDESSDVVRSLRELLVFPLESYLVDLKRTRVRLDYAVAAALRQKIEQLAPSERVGLTSAIAETIETDGGPAAARMRELLGVSVGEEPFGTPRPLRWSSAAELVKTELILETQIASADARASAAALSRLLQLHDDRHDVREAAAIVNRLQAYPDVVLPDGRTVAQMIADHTGATGDFGHEWPLRAPTITSRSWPAGDLYYLPVPVQVPRGGLFEQLNVEVDRSSGDTVRFSGAGFHRPWSLRLPPGSGTLRSALSADDLRHGWVFGHLLVLQVGADLFGIAPFDVTGEPRAQILWPEPGETVSTGVHYADDTIDPLLAAARRRAGVFWPAPRRLDRFGHPVGAVGPVTPAYFCVRRHGEIVAYETATGDEIWRIRDLSPDADCLGDVEHLVLREADSVQVRSALDASLVREDERTDHGTELLQRGVRVLYEQPGADRLQFSMVDLASGRTVWTRQFKSDAESFPIDEELLGVFEKPDQLRFLRLADGETVASHAVSAPEPLVQILAFVDATSVYVILTGARSSRGLEAATPGAGFHANDGAGRFLVNGPWHAFDRDSLALRWSSTLENASLLVNQPRDVPLIVTNELAFPDESAGRGVPTGRVRCFDRRSGEQLFDEQVGGVHTYFLVERDPDAGWVELRLAGQIVRFDYAPPEQTETSAPENR